MNNNYLTQDIKNAKKESCMTTSYVDTKKESQTKYTYEAHICEEKASSQGTDIPVPTIEIDFLDASGRNLATDNSVIENVSEARFVISYSGGERVIDEATGKKEKIAIEGYSYSVLVDPSGGNNLKEEYSSGTLSANYATDIVVNRDNNLVDYIDVTGSTTVAIRATVRNIEGGVFQVIQYAGAEPNSTFTGVNYHDSKKPECVTSKTVGEAKDDEDWINCNTDPNTERKITVVCSDGSGSGCVRSTFTKTWAGDESYEYDNIVIRDNAGNVENCRVHVNVDRKRPIINIDAFPKSGADVPMKNSSSVLTGTKTTKNSSDGTVTIRTDQYTNLYNGYMNKKNYPNGVIYKVDLSDSLSLSTWTWEVNGDIETVTSKDSPNYEVVSSTGPEATSGSCTGENSKNCSFYVKLFNNGYRKGVLTVTDKAGNTAKYTIYADINREVPKITNIINSSNSTWKGTWTSESVHLDITAEKSKKTNIDIGDYYYSFDKDVEDFSVIDDEADKKWVKLSGGTGLTSFTTKTWSEEITETAYIIVCDIAGNCSDIDDEFSTYLRIDRTPPTGLKLMGYKRKSSAYLESVDGENLEIINSDEWNSGWAIIIPTNATDGNGSGNIEYRVTVTGESTNVVDSVQNYRNVNAEGVSAVSFIACDKVGNCSQPESFIVKLDRTGPITPSISNATGGNWSTVTVTTAISSDDIASGIGKYYYSYKEDAIEIGNKPKTQWVELTDGANKKSFNVDWEDDMNETVYIKACDVLDNCTTNSTIIRIDANPPTQPVITNPNGSDWAKKNFSLTITSSDAGSGLQEYQYTYNANASEVGDDAETQWKADVNLAEENFTTTAISLEENRLMYWRACDALGNCSTKSSVRIKLDKTKPTCGTITASTNNSESGVSGTIACEDNVSGCKNDSYSFGPYTANGSIEMKDNAGNKKECTIPVTTGDCSTYSTWYYYSLYSPYSNNCPGDDVNWDYGFTECADSNAPSVCSSKCSGRSDDTICCTRRRRTLKTCYIIGE